jgi:hypothetical protein
VTLAEVRERYGQQMVLFGNLEASDIEGLDAAAFESKVQAAAGSASRPVIWPLVAEQAAKPTIRDSATTNHNERFMLFLG